MNKKFEKLFKKVEEFKERSLSGESIPEDDWNMLTKKLLKYEKVVSLGEIQASSHNFGEVEKKLKTSVKNLLDCEFVLFYQYKATDKQLSVRLQNQKTNVASYLFSDVNDSTFAGYCANHMATLKIDDVQSDIRFAKLDKMIKDKTECRNMLMAPVIFEGEILGVIQAIDSVNNDFDEDDIYFLEAIAGQLSIVLEKNHLFEKLQDQFLDIVQAFANSIGKKDLYTGGHTKRVSMFSEKIGQELGLSYKEMNDLKVSAMLHDIGKIGIEDKILKKRAPLTDEEFTIMREHPRLGHDIIGNISGLEDVVDGMRYHHERPDGKGYPYGLKGDEIPLIAHIISVADTFDAMISTRPYRKGLPPMVAYEEINNFSGTQFDSRVVEAFNSYFEKSSMYKPDSVVTHKKVG